MTTQPPNKPKRRTYSAEFKELLVQEAEVQGDQLPVSLETIASTKTFSITGNVSITAKRLKLAYYLLP